VTRSNERIGRGRGGGEAGEKVKGWDGIWVGIERREADRIGGEDIGIGERGGEGKGRAVFRIAFSWGEEGGGEGSNTIPQYL